MVRDYWDETIQEKRKAICSIGGNFLLKRRCSATFTFLLLFRPVTNQQTSNQKHLYYAEYYAAFLRKPSRGGPLGREKEKGARYFSSKGLFRPYSKTFLSRLFSRPSDHPWISKDVGRKPLIGKVIIEVATEQNITEIYSTYWKLSGCLENPAGFFLYVLWVALFFEETWT